jgi:homeodomain-containing protein
MQLCSLLRLLARPDCFRGRVLESYSRGRQVATRRSDSANWFAADSPRVIAQCSGGAGLEHPLNGAQADAGSPRDCAAGQAWLREMEGQDPIRGGAATRASQAGCRPQKVRAARKRQSCQVLSGVRSWSFMCLLLDWLKASRHLVRTAHRVLWDSLRLVARTCRSRSAVEAENLFLRKQLALFQERNLRPHRADDSTRWLMSFLSQWFDWRNALVVVKPETLIRWHRKGFRLFWRWKSRPVGRPRLPKDIQALIRQMAAENPTWGQEHIANELKLKLGIRVSPRTVGKYLREWPRREPDPSQRWLTFVRNHAQAMVACDFFVVVTTLRKSQGQGGQLPVSAPGRPAEPSEGRRSLIFHNRTWGSRPLLQ